MMTNISGHSLVDPNDKHIKEKTMKGMLWLGIFSMIMIFGAITSAYIVRKFQNDGKDWREFTLPFMFFVSTGVIILSSITMNMAFSAAKQGNNSKVKSFAGITLILGILFFVAQFLGYGQLIENGIYLVDPKAAGSYIYVLTALHMAHLLGGLIALAVVVYRSSKNKYSSDNYLGVRLASTYWHFLDGLWVYLFLFLLIIH